MAQGGRTTEVFCVERGRWNVKGADSLKDGETAEDEAEKERRKAGEGTSGEKMSAGKNPDMEGGAEEKENDAGNKSGKEKGGGGTPGDKRKEEKKDEEKAAGETERRRRRGKSIDRSSR
ncbi:hypothetical protein KUCAC02_009609 [Chaenocephalus aceratus]|nr:hypothetical protein KUCAC02_009609 [Chaenocephalus aceratus]